MFFTACNNTVIRVNQGKGVQIAQAFHPGIKHIIKIHAQIFIQAAFHGGPGDIHGTDHGHIILLLLTKIRHFRNMGGCNNMKAFDQGILQPGGIDIGGYQAEKQKGKSDHEKDDPVHGSSNIHKGHLAA